MEFESMSKSDLESHGRTIGIELDRRLVKSQLIAQLQEFITLKKIEEDMETEDVAYELEVSEHPLHPELILSLKLNFKWQRFKKPKTWHVCCNVWKKMLEWLRLDYWQPISH